MTFKPEIWFPIAVGLSLLNLIGVGVYAAEPAHATAHAVLALAFGVWAQRLRKSPGGTDDPARLETTARLEAIEAEVIKLRQELVETQERLDFAERLLAQRPEPRKVGPER